jgi:hypothetical protein
MPFSLENIEGCNSELTFYIATYLLCSTTTQLKGQIIYANAGIFPTYDGIVKIDLSNCTFCPISEMDDLLELDMVVLPNGNIVTSSSVFIRTFDPPQINPIISINTLPAQSTGGILNPSGNIYQATNIGLGEYNPITNQFSYIGNWPSNFLPIVEMELWYQGSQLYGYFGFPNLQVAQIDVNNPANSIIVGTINYSGIYFTGACNVGSTVYMSDEKTIFIYDPLTGNLNPVCDFSATNLIINGLSSVPPGFQDYACACTTNAGSITALGLSNYCTNSGINITQNATPSLDGNDLLQYVLFSNPGDTLGSIIATSNTPNFSFAPPMQTGVTYYVAAVAGNNLNGSVDLNDPCLDFSNANAVVWRPLPTVSLSAVNTNVCLSAGCTTIRATLTGTPPFSFTYEIQQNGIAIGPLVAVNNVTSILDFVVCLPANIPAGEVQVVACSATDAYCIN